MTFALKGVHEHEPSYWEVLMSFRRFLASHAHEELQKCAVDLYVQTARINPDAVWLILKFHVYFNKTYRGFHAET